MLQSNESESDFPDPIDYMEVISDRFSPPIHLDSRKKCFIQTRLLLI